MIDAFTTHIYTQNTFPKDRIEICREMASVRANILAGTPKEAGKLFKEFYEKCIKQKTGEL